MSILRPIKIKEDTEGEIPEELEFKFPLMRIWVPKAKPPKPRASIMHHRDKLDKQGCSEVRTT